MLKPPTLALSGQIVRQLCDLEATLQEATYLTRFSLKRFGVWHNSPSSTALASKPTKVFPHKACTTKFSNAIPRCQTTCTRTLFKMLCDKQASRKENRPRPKGIERFNYKSAW